MNWTDERVELLKKLWSEGLSASQIAAELGGITRNAVIGKVHRLGLSGRTKTASPASSSAPRPRKPRTPSHPMTNLFRTQGSAALAVDTAIEAETEILPEVEPTPALAEVTCEHVTIMDLRECMCRWPIGDPGRPDFRFCGSRSNSGSPYCEYHSKKAYQPTIDRRRERRNAA